jgi:hypothetical protein
MHGRPQLHMVGARLERVQGGQRDLAPIANRPNDDAARAVLDHLQMLIAVRPSRPVVGYEIREHRAIASDFPVAHRGDVDDGAARNTERRRRIDRERESQLFVDDRQVMCRPRLAVDDGSRADDDPNLRRRRPGQY